MCKPIFQYGTNEDIEATCTVLLYVLDTSFRLINPIMPFLTETLYCALPGKDKTSIENMKFPESIEVYFTIINLYLNAYVIM